MIDKILDPISSLFGDDPNADTYAALILGAGVVVLGAVVFYLPKQVKKRKSAYQKGKSAGKRAKPVRRYRKR